MDKIQPVAYTKEFIKVNATHAMLNVLLVFLMYPMLQHQVMVLAETGGGNVLPVILAII